MKNLLLILLLTASFCALGVEEDYTGDSENDRECEVSTVLNQASGTGYTITRCVELMSKGELIEAVKTKQPEPHAQKSPHYDWQRINSNADLLAQQIMADATKRIRDYTLTGVVIGLVGLWFLRRTVLQTQSASDYAFQTLNVAKNSTEIELQPYFTFDFKNVFIGTDSTSVGHPSVLSFQISINNDGKAPATDVMVDFAGKDRSVFVRFVPPDEGNQISYRFKDERIFASCRVITKDTPGKLILSGQTSPLVPDKIEEYLINLSEFTVRYKDFTCAPNEHKIAHCLISITKQKDGRPQGTMRVTEYGKNKEQDEGHARYHAHINPSETVF